jgi:osmotically-inducible protein OsmY
MQIKPRNRQSNRTTALLAGIGIGAALMYLLDPGGGARRRALVRDRTASALRSARRELRDRAVDARNRARGFVAERRRGAGEPLDGDRLVARVRAELGHHSEHVRDIEVVADGGTVTLRGAIPAHERDEVLAAVRRVRGVERLNDELGAADVGGAAPGR